jgi:cytochrome c
MSERLLPVALTSLVIVLAGSLVTGAFQPAQAAGDAAAGRSVFQSVCAMCHSPLAGQNRIGPSLFGVVGRHTASVPGYNYSPANKAANLTWDEATLDKYLESPQAVVPGTKMTYGGLKDATKRANLIAYLATLK